MRTRAGQGFTLVELLVALLIGGLVLGAVVAVNVGTARSAAQLQARNDLLPETELAEGYLAAKLQQAVYLFPPGSALRLSGSGETTRNPLTGGYTWTVGQDPIVAFVLPPEVAGGTCSASVLSGCATFYADYPARRGAFVKGVSGANNPGPDPLNAQGWVLLEYRAHYPAGAVYAGATTLPAAMQGGSGRLLMDHLRPTAAGEPLFTVSADSRTPGRASVRLSLAARRVVPGLTVDVPAQGRREVTVYPRNLEE